MKHEELTKNVFPRQSSPKTVSQTVEKYQMPWGVSGGITSPVCPDLWGMSWMGCSVSSSLLSAAVVPRRPCYLLQHLMMKIHCEHMKRIVFSLYDWHSSSHLSVDGCRGLK